MRRSLPQHALLTLVNALVIIKLDDCNSVLAGTASYLQNRLQSVLNAAARLIFSRRASEHMHNPTAPGPSLVTRTRANPVSVVCSGMSLCAWHSTGVSCRQRVQYIFIWQHSRTLMSACGRHQSSSPVAIFALPTRLRCWCRRLVGYYSWRPRLSGGSGASVEQSASTDQGRLVAVVFSAVDKGPSVSAVVQLTSDYCLPSFFL